MKPSPPSRLLLATLLSLAALAPGLAGCPADPVGLPCLGTVDCQQVQPFQSCYLPPDPQVPDGGLVFGFCSRSCDTEGQQTGCPGESVCTATAGTRVCAPLCGTEDDCVEGTVCRPVTGGASACIFPPQG